MKVDNGLKLWSYAGELQQHLKFERLYGVVARPSAPGVHPDRPASPSLKDRVLKEQKQEKPKKYVPPSMRGRASSADDGLGRNDGPKSLAELESSIARASFLPSFASDRSSEAVGYPVGVVGVGAARFARPGAPGSPPVSVPGASKEMTKSALKKQKQKQKQKEAEEAKAKGGVADGKQENEKVEEEEKETPVVPAAEPVASVDEFSGPIPEDAEKRIKNVTKKLRQISQLRERAVSGQLDDPSAKEKISQETRLLRELAWLKGEAQ